MLFIKKGACSIVVRSSSAVFLLCWLSAAFVGAQNTNYGQAYQQMLRTHPGMYDGNNRYLYNKYYKSNVAISPYLSGAILGGSDYGTAYTTVTRPEIQRRESNMRSQAQYVQQRKLQGNIGHTMYPGSGYMGASPGTGYSRPSLPKVNRTGAYQNHWYGKWNK